jgi:hypothetical protein
MTLFEIGAEGAALQALIEEHLTENEGELTPEAEAAIDGWLAENNESLEKKLDGYGALIRECEAKANARYDEAARLELLADADANKAKRLKERLRWYFEANGIEKQETARYKFTLANNGGVLPLQLSEVSPSELPEHFQSVRVEVDKAATREFLENGGTLEWARLGERGKSLRIR